MASLELYRVFLTVAECQNVTRAAEQLHLSQPAVSHALRQLEDSLAVQLFTRTSRGVRLTPEGTTLHRFVAQAQQLLDAGERQVREAKELQNGEIRVSAGDTLCRQILLPILGEFHTLFPNIHIRVTNRTSPETVEALSRGIVDFGLVHLPLEASGLEFTELTSVQDVFVASTRKKTWFSRTWSPADLVQLPLMLLERTSNSRRTLDTWFERRGVTLKPDIELGSVDLLVQFASVGLGAACVPRECVRSAMEAGDLAELALDEPLPNRHIAIATARQASTSLAARALIDRLGQEYKHKRPV